MKEHGELKRLASLIGQRNTIDGKIAEVIGRPAHPWYIGEFVAARVFDIKLNKSATQKGTDGYFSSGPLAGKSVDVKKHSTESGTLDIRIDALPDFFLVLTGPRTPPTSSRGETQPWTIEAIFLFEAALLARELNERGVKVGVATSVRRRYWDAAEIYPSPKNSALQLNPEQIAVIELFSDYS